MIMAISKETKKLIKKDLIRVFEQMSGEVFAEEIENGLPIKYLIKVLRVYKKHLGCNYKVNPGNAGDFISSMSGEAFEEVYSKLHDETNGLPF